MPILRADREVISLRGDYGEIRENTYIDCVADSTVHLVETVTCPSFASAGQGDFFYFDKPDGDRTVVWLDKDDDGTSSSGAIFAGNENEIQVDIVTGDTAAEVRDKVLAAIQAAGVLDVLAASSGTADVNITIQQDGSTSFGRKNLAESGNGSFSLAEATAYSAGNYGGKYFIIYDKDGNRFNPWFNVDGLDSAPALSGTELEVAISSADSAASVGAALASVLDARAEFDSADQGNGRVVATVVGSGTPTDASAGDSPVSVSVENQGFVALVSSAADVSGSLYDNDP